MMGWTKMGRNGGRELERQKQRKEEKNDTAGRLEVKMEGGK